MIRFPFSQLEELRRSFSLRPRMCSSRISITNVVGSIHQERKPSASSFLRKAGDLVCPYQYRLIIRAVDSIRLSLALDDPTGHSPGTLQEVHRGKKERVDVPIEAIVWIAAIHDVERRCFEGRITLGAGGCQSLSRDGWGCNGSPGERKSGSSV